jgi:hypothetical protein
MLVAGRIEITANQETLVTKIALETVGLDTDWEDRPVLLDQQRINQ